MVALVFVGLIRVQAEVLVSRCRRPFGHMQRGEERAMDDREKKTTGGRIRSHIYICVRACTKVPADSSVAMIYD